MLVRIERADGTGQVLRLKPDSPSFVVEPAPGALQVAATYTGLGVEHILLGVDHLLFVLALLILVDTFRRLAWTITAFTAAHSITLAVATLGLVTVPPPPVEAVIALSIVFVAGEIIRARQRRPGLAQRLPALVAFTFGLLHGVGFAARSVRWGFRNTTSSGPLSHSRRRRDRSAAVRRRGSCSFEAGRDAAPACSRPGGGTRRPMPLVRWERSGVRAGGKIRTMIWSPSASYGTLRRRPSAPAACAATGPPPPHASSYTPAGTSSTRWRTWRGGSVSGSVLVPPERILAAEGLPPRVRRGAYGFLPLGRAPLPPDPMGMSAVRLERVEGLTLLCVRR